MQPNPAVKEDAAAARQIRIETMYLANMLVGGDGSGQLVIEASASPEDTVESFLRRVSAGYPKLKEALWDRKTGGLSGDIAITVNGVPLGLKHLPGSSITDVHTMGLVYASCGGI